MQFSLMAGRGVGEENGGWLAEDPAFRCGHSIRGVERLSRDAGSPPALFAREGAGELLEVTWSRDEFWAKPIRVLES